MALTSCFVQAIHVRAVLCAHRTASAFRLCKRCPTSLRAALEQLAQWNIDGLSALMLDCAACPSWGTRTGRRQALMAGMRRACAIDVSTISASAIREGFAAPIDFRWGIALWTGLKTRAKPRTGRQLPSKKLFLGAVHGSNSLPKTFERQGSGVRGPALSNDGYFLGDSSKGLPLRRASYCPHILNTHARAANLPQPK
jgi:hypothetical protein